MKIKSFIAIIAALLISSTVFAAKIESLKVSVSGGNGSYSSSTSAILVGDYNRYVDRMLNLNNFRGMGVPHFRDSKRLGKSIGWIHMRVFFTDSKYYTRSTTTRGPKMTKVVFRLAPKSGPYPEKHNYASLNGTTTVQVLSGSGENTKFKVTASSRFTLKPGAPEIGIKGIMKKIAAGSVKAFSK